MGNLSCVSCQNKPSNKEKPIQRSIGELTQANNKGATYNQDIGAAPDKEELSTKERSQEDGVRFVENVELTVAPQRRTTAGELYEVLQSLRLKDDGATDDDQLEDVEKAAKAIVDMTVFLTTQVIYPAYIRYLKEDHPDAYTQMFERSSDTLPVNNAITVGGGDR